MQNFLISEKKVHTESFSALKQNQKNIYYYDFISSLKNDSCNNALIRIFPCIDLKFILHLIKEMPEISNVRKEFYMYVLTQHYFQVLESAYKNLKDRKINERNLSLINFNCLD